MPGNKWRVGSSPFHWRFNRSMDSTCGYFSSSRIYNWDGYLASDRTLTFISWSVRKRTVTEERTRNQMVANSSCFVRCGIFAGPDQNSLWLLLDNAFFLQLLSREAHKRVHFSQQGTTLRSLFCFRVFMLLTLFCHSLKESWLS